MKIERFSNANVRPLPAAIESALAELGRQHGVAFRIRGSKFSDTNGSFELGVSLIDSATGIEWTPEREAFVEHAACQGLSPTDLDRTFLYEGMRFQIVGMNLQARRFSIIGKRLEDGKGFRFNPADVKQCLANPDAG